MVIASRDPKAEAPEPIKRTVKKWQSGRSVGGLLEKLTVCTELQSEMFNREKSETPHRSKGHFDLQ
jgi:hypothetical protein